MRQCPKCGTNMVQWERGRPGNPAWRCPACSRIRRKDRHNKVAVDATAELVKIESRFSTPYLSDTDMTLYNGDAVEILRQLSEKSVQMCATSPPFFGLRNYGVEGQIGLEETPDEWVENLVAVFREVRRVLRDDGTLWVEIGDSYNQNHSPRKESTKTSGFRPYNGREITHVNHPTKPKDLLGQPWMLAFALRADGWYLRSEIIWHKLNTMPESVQDRPTRSHSTVFLLSKNERYFYDIDAVREPHKHDGRHVTTVKQGENSIQHRDGERWPGTGANLRSVWGIATEATPFAHFATWPQKLVRPMILAGTSEKGCCPECGAPWKRDVEIGDLVGDDHGGNRRGDEEAVDASLGNRFRSVDKPEFRPGMAYERIDNGWVPGCDHDTELVPCTVLDPFAGSGTTMLVARSLARHSIGIELNPEYCKMTAERTQQLSLLT